MRSGFIRSRKVVDTDWMIGKTVDHVRERYYYPRNIPDYLSGEKVINGEIYTLCNIEKQIWEGGTYSGSMFYYVRTDEAGKITKVFFISRDRVSGDMPEHSYLSRWYSYSL